MEKIWFEVASLGPKTGKLGARKLFRAHSPLAALAQSLKLSSEEEAEEAEEGDWINSMNYIAALRPIRKAVPVNSGEAIEDQPIIGTACTLKHRKTGASKTIGVLPAPARRCNRGFCKNITIRKEICAECEEHGGMVIASHEAGHNTIYWTHKEGVGYRNSDERRDGTCICGTFVGYLYRVKPEDEPRWKTDHNKGWRAVAVGVGTLVEDTSLDKCERALMDFHNPD